MFLSIHALNQEPITFRRSRLQVMDSWLNSTYKFTYLELAVYKLMLSCKEKNVVILSVTSFLITFSWHNGMIIPYLIYHMLYFRMFIIISLMFANDSPIYNNQCCSNILSLSVRRQEPNRAKIGARTKENHLISVVRTPIVARPAG